MNEKTIADFTRVVEQTGFWRKGRSQEHHPNKLAHQPTDTANTRWSVSLPSRRLRRQMRNAALAEYNRWTALD